MKNKLILEQQKSIKGYSKEILLNSFEKLRNVIDTSFFLPFECANKANFVDNCLNFAFLLPEIREILFYISKNQGIDINYMHNLYKKIKEILDFFSSYNYIENAYE